MKRHPGLAPLSREHHHALVLARRLILGRSTNPRAGWPTDRGQQVPLTIQFFATDLRSHFEAEEADLFPVVIAHLPGTAGLVDQLIADHAAMRMRIHDLERDPSSDLGVRLPDLGRLLESHIRREERDLFETMQREMDEAVLAAIGAQLRRRARGMSCQVGPAR